MCNCSIWDEEWRNGEHAKTKYIQLKNDCTMYIINRLCVCVKGAEKIKRLIAVIRARALLFTLFLWIGHGHLGNFRGGPQ